MRFYDRHVLPRLIDLTCGLPPFDRQRQAVVPQAHGRVLEVGFGSGRNLPYYDAAKVVELVALDPHAGLQRLAQARSAGAAFPVRPITAGAEGMASADATFDSVVMTYTLCSVADPAQVLREIVRVLRPGGQLLFCEHGRAPDAAIQKWQNRLTPAWRRLAGNCHLNRDIPALLAAAGFQTAEPHSGYIPGPRVLTWNVWGRACPR